MKNNDFYVIEEKDYAIVFHRDTKKVFKTDTGVALSLCRYLNDGAEDNHVKEIKEELSTQKVYERKNGQKGKRLSRLSIITTQRCNCKCKYCFANEGTYNDETMHGLSDEDCEAVFAYLFEEYEEGINLIQFFGGEPLLEFARVKSIVELSKKYIKEDVKPPRFAVVTNGTLFTGEMIDFFNEENIDVIISIDGDKEVNDIARISKGGFSVYDKIHFFTELLNSNRTFSMFAEGTINRFHVKRYKKGIVKHWIKDMLSLGVDGVILGVVDTDIDTLKINDCKATFEEMYNEVIDCYFELMMTQEKIIAFPDLIGIIKHLTNDFHAYPCGAGYSNLSITTKGELFPCYQFALNGDYKMARVENGKIVQEEKYDEIQAKFMDIKETVPAECKDCWASSICNVWCRGMSMNRYKDISHISEPRCWIIKTAIRGVLRNIVRLKEKPEHYTAFCKKMILVSERFSK